MKKILTLALGVVAMLTSCSKEDIGSSVNPNTDQVTITLAAEDVVATRAASEAPTRYIVEVYSDKECTSEVNMFGEYPNLISQTTIDPVNGTATLNLTIDRTQDYYFLFWSDVSGSDVYTTTSLTAVTLNSGKTPVESWQGTAQILKGTSQPTLSVTLSRAVAKINLMETGALPAVSSLAMTFDQNTVFDVSSGSVSTTATRTETIENESAISGSTTTAVQLNSSEIYLFAAVESQTVHDITFEMNDEDEDSFKITSVPFQANHATNITGHYTKLSSETFTLSVDDTWATPDNDVDVAPVDIALVTVDDDEVYQIYSAEGLQAFASIVNNSTTDVSELKTKGIDGTSITQNKSANGQLMNDIDLSSLCGWVNGTTESDKSWTPIGNFSNTYAGTFNGGGYLVSGLYINATTDYQGLFGYISGATIESIGVSGDVILSSNTRAGGIVGQAVSSSEITECYFLGTVSSAASNAASNGYAGGIAGTASLSTLTRCYNSGAIEGSGTYANVGGIVGSISGSTVAACYNSGTVTGSNTYSPYVGGVVGTATSSGSTYSTVTSCYSYGSVSSANSSYLGGVVGMSISYSTISYCYYDTYTVNANDGKYTPTGAVAGVDYSGTVSGATANTTYVIETYGFNSNTDSTPMTTLLTNLNSGITAYNIDYDPDLNNWETDSQSINSGYPILSW